MRIPQSDAAVLEHRNLAKRIALDDGAFLMGAAEEIDGCKVERQAEQRAEQADLIAIAGQFEVVEFQRGHGCSSAFGQVSGPDSCPISPCESIVLYSQFIIPDFERVVLDQLAAIRVFVAIAEGGSLSAAGRRLGMPLPTVSRHLMALEDRLDRRLVTRTTRRLALTEAGRLYLDSSRRILAEFEAVELRLAGEQADPQGELALTAPVSFGRLHVLPVVTDYLRAFPRVAVRMLLLDRVVDLVEEGLDIAVRSGKLPDFIDAGDQGRYDPLCRLRQPVLSRRVRNTGHAQGARRS